MTEQTRSRTPNRSAEPASDEIDLTRLFALVQDNWLKIALVTLIAMAMGVAYALLATPIYRADALLQVEAKQSGLPVLGELSELISSESSAQTEIELIRSRMVLGAAVDELHADVLVEPRRTPFIGRFTAPAPTENRILFSGWADAEQTLWVDQLQVPAWLQGKDLTLRVTDGGFDLLGPDGELLASGRSGAVAESEDGRVVILVRELSAQSGQEFTVTKLSRVKAIQMVQAELSVSEKGRNTGILALSMTDPRPARVETLLNAVAQNYFLQNVQRRSAEAEKSLEFLDEQVPAIQQDLTSAEEKLNAYRLKSESVDLSLETKAVLDQLVSLEASLVDLRLKESEVSRLYTSEHPAYRTLMQQKKNFEDERDRLNRQVKGLPETQQEILRLMRDVELNQQIYVQLLNRTQELRIMKAGTVGNVRIIDKAEVAPDPVKPQKPLIVALTTLLGLMAGLGYVFVKALFNRGLENPDQLEQEGISVYATLPLSEDQQRNERIWNKVRRRRGETSGSGTLLADSSPGDLAIEALRSLRTSLHFAMLEANNNVLMISGPSPGVGKSFVAANFAAVLAQAGQSVVLVDADMRKGLLHRYFANEKSNTGLSALLSGRAELSQVIQSTNTEGLSFIPRGEVPPNPAELLMHSRFKALIDELSKQFDLVLVDTPPIMAVTDAAIIGQSVGTSLLVARYGRSSVKEVEQAILRFEHNGVEIKGCIFNAVERTASNAYYYYAYEYK
ncbi:polysaccharide biosynthesis tyrosine autokinase [Isoalcanivorax beigongshangi]|uniref:Polysaccharide biosynthesis tyrosine autokinase n=1 Tax=Isoalcanivorax beigongshangi TaxID=3238810 RepID=A0ABV4AFZ6_9GAMM